MRVVDLAQAIAPDVPARVDRHPARREAARAPDHADEARHTIDAGEVYVVLPEHPWWDGKGSNLEGTRLPDGFEYASNTNDEWLTLDELGALLPAA